MDHEYPLDFERIRTGIQEARWPAIPDATASAMMAMQFQYAATERLPPADILSHQLRQLGPLLMHAYRTVPFYRETYRAEAFRPRHLLTPEIWGRVPVISRSALQQAGSALLTEKAPASHGGMEDVSTSGSTGRTVVVKANELTAFLWRALTLREHLWHGRDPAGKLAVIRKAAEDVGLPPEGLRSEGWGPATGAVFRTGPAVLLNVMRTSIDEQTDWLLRHQPDYLLAYPSTLAGLLRRIEETGARLDGLREVRTLGEVVPPELRTACRRVLGAPLVDMYSCQEAGYLAFQCPQHEHLHVQSENVLLEVLNESNRPCAPGETGRVVITSLHNFATPLIRYEIGDYAEVGPPCRCGRTLPVLTRVLGRVRNLVTLPSGEKRWPLVGSDAYTRVAPVEQFQLIQWDRERIEVKLVLSQGLTGQQEIELTRIIHAYLGHPFTLSFSCVADIPRGPGGKFEDFVSHVQ